MNPALLEKRAVAPGPPVPTHRPTATLAIWGISAVAMVNLLSNRVR